MKNNKNQKNNLAFIDGQNLYMGTNSETPAWEVNLAKFRNYLSRKENIMCKKLIIF